MSSRTTFKRCLSVLLLKYVFEVVVLSHVYFVMLKLNIKYCKLLNLKDYKSCKILQSFETLLIHNKAEDLFGLKHKVTATLLHLFVVFVIGCFTSHSKGKKC
jgi:hypothetical protein